VCNVYTHTQREPLLHGSEEQPSLAGGGGGRGGGLTRHFSFHSSNTYRGNEIQEKGGPDFKGDSHEEGTVLYNV
jgi:hypothetical protein